MEWIRQAIGTDRQSVLAAIARMVTFDKPFEKRLDAIIKDHCERVKKRNIPITAGKLCGFSSGVFVLKELPRVPTIFSFSQLIIAALKLLR